MNDELYYKYQPVTWDIGVVDAPAEKVADAVAYTDPLSLKIAPAHQQYDSVDDVFLSLEPLSVPGKLIVIATKDGRALLFTNSLRSVTEYATWGAGETHDTRAYFVLRAPTTIAPDKKSGEWGARQLTVRDPGNMKITQEPTFSIGVINNCGQWVMERYGTPQSYEDHNAYKLRRVKDRFTDEMLINYCDALNIPVYDRQWYTNNVYTVAMQFVRGNGMTYREAAAYYRIPEQVR